MTESACIVCSTSTNKYKCSKCLQHSCSLACYKTHKENDTCVPPPPPIDGIDSAGAVEDHQGDEALRLQMFTTDDTVAPSKLAELANSDRLRALLRNPHLREYLRQLDATPDAWKGMKVAMLEPLFVEFADECLAVVEPDTDSASRAAPLSESEQIVGDFCTAVVQQVDAE